MELDGNKYSYNLRSLAKHWFVKFDFFHPIKLNKISHSGYKRMAILDEFYFTKSMIC